MPAPLQAETPARGPAQGGRFTGLARLRWLILGLLFLSTVINYIDRQALSVLEGTISKDLGLTPQSYGTITSFFLIAQTVGWIVAGIVIDKIGTRIGLALMVLAWSVAALLHASVSGPLALGVFRGILGFAEAGNWPAGGKAIASWFPRDRRAFAMAVFDGGSAVGAILAPPMVSALAIWFGWRAAFIVTGLLGLAWLAGWLYVYQSPETHPQLSPADRAGLLAEVGPLGRGGGLGAAMRHILPYRKLWGLMATRMLATPVWWFYIFWLPSYLSHGRGFTQADIGRYAWIPFLTVDLGKVLGGSVSDALLARGAGATFARKAVMVCGALVMMGGLMVPGAATSAAAIAWVCVATFGFGMWSANILALHADLFPASAMGSAIGLTGMAASLGGAIFSYAVGKIVGAYGYAPAFWAVGSLSLVACSALFFGVGRVEMIDLETKEKSS